MFLKHPFDRKSFELLLHSYIAGPSCLLGSFFCFLAPSDSAFGFLDSLLVFFSFAIPNLHFNFFNLIDFFRFSDLNSVEVKH